MRPDFSSVRVVATALAVWAAGPVLIPSASGGAPFANGTIRGRVELRQPARDLTPRPHAGDVAMPRPHDPTDRRRSVVYLETAPRAAFDHRDEPRAKLDQRNEAFAPHVLAIVAGTTVDFPNNDTTYHNVFSLSSTKSFDLGRYPVGRSKSVKFDRPGIVRVFCDIHSHMSAFILVFAHRHFAVTDEEGRYRIDNVPPGTYTVLAWNESAPSESRRVVVPEAGGDVEAHFSLGRR
jgi:plastocyanin